MAISFDDFPEFLGEISFLGLSFSVFFFSTIIIRFDSTLKTIFGILEYYESFLLFSEELWILSSPTPRFN